MDSIVGILLLLIFPGNFGQVPIFVQIASLYVQPISYPNITAYFAEGQNASEILSLLPYCLNAVSLEYLYPLDLIRVTPSFKLMTRRPGVHYGREFFQYWNRTANPTLTPDVAGSYQCKSLTTGDVSTFRYILNVVRKPVLECEPSYEVAFGQVTYLNIIAFGTLPATITRHPPIGRLEVWPTVAARGVRRWVARLVVNGTADLGSQIDMTFNIAYSAFVCSGDRNYPNSSAFQRCASVPTHETCKTTIFVKAWDNLTCPATEVHGLNKRILKSNPSTVISNFWCSNNMVIGNNIKSVVCDQNGEWSELPKCVCPYGRKCVPDEITVWEAATVLLGTTVVCVIAFAALVVKMTKAEYRWHTHELEMRAPLTRTISSNS